MILVEADVRLRLAEFDATNIALITRNIILQREKQTLGVLGSKDYTALNICLWQTWQNSREIEYKFRCRMRNNRLYLYYKYSFRLAMPEKLKFYF